MRRAGVYIGAMKIVVVGGGAMGLIHAALLSQVAQVSLVVRGEQQALAVRNEGVTIINSDGQRTQHQLAASSTPQALDEADVVIIAVKSFQTGQVAQLLAASSNQKSVVVSVQNGIHPHEVLAQACGQPRVLLGMTYYAGSRVDLTAVQVNWIGTTVIGERHGGSSGRVLELEQLFRRAGIQVEASDDMWSVVWTKFAQSCCQNALSALARKPFSELVESQSALKLLQLLSQEMTQLAAMENVKLLFDPHEQLLKNWVGLNHRSSMLQDLQAARPTEIDELNGEAVRRGEVAGLEMATNRAVWLLVKASEASMASA